MTAPDLNDAPKGQLVSFPTTPPQKTSFPGAAQGANSAYRAAMRQWRQGCKLAGGFAKGSGDNIQCLGGDEGAEIVAAIGENSPDYERAQDWLADYYAGTDAGTGPDVDETTEVVDLRTEQEIIDDFQAQIDELFNPGTFTIEGIEDGQPVVVVENEDGTFTTIVGIEDLQEYEEAAAAAAEEAAAAAAEEAAAAEQAAAEKRVSEAVAEAAAEGDFERAEEIAKDFEEEYGGNADITGEANKDVVGAEQAYKDREREAEQAEQQTNSGIEVEWADYEIVNQREDGCYNVREKSSGTVFVACPGDVVDGVSVDSGDKTDEVVDINDDTTEEGEDGGDVGFTFGGGSVVKDLIADGAETEQKDKDAKEAEEAEEEVKDKDAEEAEAEKDKDAEAEKDKDAEAEKDKDAEKAEQDAKDIAEQLLKDSNNNGGGDNGEEPGDQGFTFGGGSDTKDTGDGGGTEVVDDDGGEEPGDQGFTFGGGSDTKDTGDGGGETEIEIALDPTKDGGDGGGEEPGDQGFTFGGGSDTKDTETAEEVVENPIEDPVEETEPAGDVGLTFGGGSVVKDGKDGTGSSDTETGKDGTGDSDSEGPGDGKDGTGDSDTEGPGEEEAMSLFSLTKDAALPQSRTSTPAFKDVMYGISYEAPTVQNIIQSPNVDYMAQLNKIINKGMLV